MKKILCSLFLLIGFCSITTIANSQSSVLPLPNSSVMDFSDCGASSTQTPLPIPTPLSGLDPLDDAD